MPCNDGTLLHKMLSSDGVLDVDVPVVKVSGAVTLKGAAMPSASDERGNVLFALVGGGQLRSGSFGATGAASYRLTLLPGSYIGLLDGNEALCGKGTPFGTCMDDVLLGCP